MHPKLLLFSKYYMYRRRLEKLACVGSKIIYYHTTTITATQTANRMVKCRYKWAVSKTHGPPLGNMNIIYSIHAWKRSDVCTAVLVRFPNILLLQVNSGFLQQNQRHAAVQKQGLTQQISFCKETLVIYRKLITSTYMYLSNYLLSFFWVLLYCKNNHRYPVYIVLYKI